MNHRGKRLAFTVAATGLAVLLGLGILHWGTVRDHAESWQFQLTRETETIEPEDMKEVKFSVIDETLGECHKIAPWAPLLIEKQRAEAEKAGSQRAEAEVERLRRELESLERKETDSA